MNRVTHCDRILALLADGQEHSHHELYGLYTVAHSRISDLRKRGHHIEMRRDGDTYWYRLSGSLTAGDPPPFAPVLTGPSGANGATPPAGVSSPAVSDQGQLAFEAA